jgi:hypothetical protein
MSTPGPAAGPRDGCLKQAPSEPGGAQVGAGREQPGASKGVAHRNENAVGWGGRRGDEWAEFVPASRWSDFGRTYAAGLGKQGGDSPGMGFGLPDPPNAPYGPHLFSRRPLSGHSSEGVATENRSCRTGRSPRTDNRERCTLDPSCIRRARGLPVSSSHRTSCPADPSTHAHTEGRSVRISLRTHQALGAPPHSPDSPGPRLTPRDLRGITSRGFDRSGPKGDCQPGIGLIRRVLAPPSRKPCSPVGRPTRDRLNQAGVGAFLCTTSSPPARACEITPCAAKVRLLDNSPGSRGPREFRGKLQPTSTRFIPAPVTRKCAVIERSRRTRRANDPVESRRGDPATDGAGSVDSALPGVTWRTRMRGSTRPEQGLSSPAKAETQKEGATLGKGKISAYEGIRSKTSQLAG